MSSQLGQCGWVLVVLVRSDTSFISSWKISMSRDLWGTTRLYVYKVRFLKFDTVDILGQCLAAP